MHKQLQATTAFLDKQNLPKASIGIILGTGLDALVEHMELLHEISYADIPHLPAPTMAYHKGKLSYCRWGEQNLWVCQGRFHRYEGYSFFEVSYLVRILAHLGVKTLIMSNAAGAINLSMKKGEVMLLEDHINLQGDSPLAVKGITALGERFVDMSVPYDKDYRQTLLNLAKELSIPLHQGTYAAVVGPQLETPAEYRYLKIIGADAVGMSTVPEVIVARQLQLRVVAFSVLTDECDPDNLHPIDIPDIMAQAKKGEVFLQQLLQAFLARI